MEVYVYKKMWENKGGLIIKKYQVYVYWLEFIVCEFVN